MRNLPRRPALPAHVRKQLTRKTEAILALVERKQRQDKAHSSYKAARSKKWFQTILQVLRDLAGDTRLCMYCSSNEPSQVEHYRPLSLFP